MKKFALIALTSVFTLCTVLPSQAASLPNQYPMKNPNYPQDRSWDYADQGANAGGGGGGD